MTLLDYAAIRRRIRIRRVLQLMAYQPTIRGDHHWRGHCPLAPHPLPRASQRCFVVNLQRDLFYCFACRRGGNSLDLWVAATGLPLHTATLDLCRRLGIEPVQLADPQPPNPT